MTKEEMLALLEGYLSAWQRRDAVACYKVYAQDARMDDPTLTAPLQGHSAIRAYFRDNFAKMPANTTRQLLQVGLGNNCIFFEWVIKSMDEQGLRQDSKGTSVWEVRDGQVVWDRSYWYYEKLGNLMSESKQITVTRPQDFDAFWQETIQEMTGLPRDFQVTPDPLRSNEEAEIFQVRYRSLGGVRIFGWYGFPRGQGVYPAILLLPGYGSYDWPPRAWARAGFAAFILQPRGHMGSDEDYCPGFPGLVADGLEDRYQYSYRGVYADCWLAFQFLLNRPELDSKHIATTGRSQGGALALITAGLCPEVAAVAADVPFLTGIQTAFKLADGYAYAEIGDYLQVNPERAEAVWTTLSYFDVLNFAGQITCPVLLSLGLRDAQCPPVTGQALFETLPGSHKVLREYPNAGHEGGGVAHDGFKLAWLREQLSASQIRSS